MLDITCYHQNRFRMAVAVRDSQCLVTDVDYESCTACHIVPQSREDVSLMLQSLPLLAHILVRTSLELSYGSQMTIAQLYRTLLSLPRSPPIFHPSSGLLLEDALHRAYDRLELSFYYEVRTISPFKLSD